MIVDRRATLICVEYYIRNLHGFPFMNKKYGQIVLDDVLKVGSAISSNVHGTGVFFPLS